MAWKSDFLSDLLESVSVIPKKSACVSQYLIGGEGLCVLKGLGITCLEDWFNDNVLLPNPRSTYLIHISDIYIVSLHSLWQFGLHFFLFAICHHGSLHPPFTKRFRYPKWTILAVSFHHCRSLDLRHLEGLMVYSPSLFFKGLKWTSSEVNEVSTVGPDTATEFFLSFMATGSVPTKIILSILVRPRRFFAFQFSHV